MSCTCCPDLKASRLTACVNVDAHRGSEGNEGTLSLELKVVASIGSPGAEGVVNEVDRRFICFLVADSRSVNERGKEPSVDDAICGDIDDCNSRGGNVMGGDDSLAGRKVSVIEA